MSKLPGIPSGPADGPVVALTGAGKPYVIGVIFNEGMKRYEAVIQFGDFATAAEAEMFAHRLALTVQEVVGGRQQRVGSETPS